MIEKNTDEVLKDASTQGISQMITIGCHPGDFDRVVQITKKYYPTVAATLGVHPHEAKHYSDEVESQIKTLVEANKEIIGIGEIGLDYYYSHSDHDVQKAVFRRQMQLASDLGYPVEIHSRDAEDDTIAELQHWNGKVTGCLHCFTGSKRLADAALDAGYYISVSGVITFKNADELRSVVSQVPLDRLLIETDAPFLAPVPLRGKKNEPAFLIHTAKHLAQLKAVSLEELAQITTQNIKKLFSRWR
ncbi:MAG: TatD family hydrolase [Oligoflexia bacterium]|nr:TatD family hydrolase [Oligoflexia bacterium]